MLCCASSFGHWCWPFPPPTSSPRPGSRATRRASKAWIYSRLPAYHDQYTLSIFLFRLISTSVRILIARTSLLSMRLLSNTSAKTRTNKHKQHDCTKRTEGKLNALHTWFGSSPKSNIIATTQRKLFLQACTPEQGAMMNMRDFGTNTRVNFPTH